MSSECSTCGDIREGYYEYVCGDCGATTKVGFTCKSRLCLRCFKVAVDDWLQTARKVLFEGVVHRQTRRSGTVGWARCLHGTPADLTATQCRRKGRWNVL